MKIVLVLVRNIFACHYSMFGYKETLERMGHTVVELAFPGNSVRDVERIRAQMPTIEQLNECDVVLGMYHEYTQPWLAEIYGFENWQKLKVPVVLRMEETMDRMDLGLPGRWPELKKWGQFYSWPTVQDAETYGGEFHPYGADTTLFHPGTVGEGFSEKALSRPVEKKYDLAFIGSLYPMRKSYLTALQPHLPDSITFNVGSCFVQDLSGTRARESFDLLAENYRQMKIFFCLPPMSRMLVEKIFDVMGSGTFVMYPKLFGPSAKNMQIFEDKKHIVYYEMGYVTSNAEQIQYYLKNDKEREEIARAGCELVRSKYTLAQMLEAIIAMASKSIPSPQPALSQ